MSIPETTHTNPWIKDFYRGDKKRIIFRLKDADGNALSVHGGVLRFVMKNKIDDAISVDTPVNKSTEGVEADIQNPTGEIVIELLHDDTKNLLGKYFWELEYRDASGQPVTCLPPVNTRTSYRQITVNTDLYNE
jgi:hypothetical protein